MIELAKQSKLIGWVIERIVKPKRPRKFCANQKPTFLFFEQTLLRGWYKQIASLHFAIAVTESDHSQSVQVGAINILSRWRAVFRASLIDSFDTENVETICGAAKSEGNVNERLNRTKATWRGRNDECESDFPCNAVVFWELKFINAQTVEDNDFRQIVTIFVRMFRKGLTHKSQFIPSASLVT